MHTQHSRLRAQQRCVQPLMDELLDRYGREQHDHHGAVIVFFDKDSWRRMERDLGRHAVACLCRWRHVYKVRSTDGCTVTLGYRTRRIRRV